jgi:hypothetical protein
MFTIAGGIVLGFFAIVIILTFAEQILHLIGGLLAFVLFAAALVLVISLINLVPYVKESLGGVIMLVVFGSLAFGALVALRTATKAVCTRVGNFWGALIMSGLFAVPFVFSYDFSQAVSGFDTSTFAALAVGFSLIWGALVWWISMTFSLIGDGVTSLQLRSKNRGDQASQLSSRPTDEANVAPH